MTTRDTRAERDARLAAALRANLRRRKADTASPADPTVAEAPPHAPPPPIGER